MKGKNKRIGTRQMYQCEVQGGMKNQRQGRGRDTKGNCSCHGDLVLRICAGLVTGVHYSPNTFIF
jgi:hypothetical protein